HAAGDRAWRDHACLRAALLDAAHPVAESGDEAGREARLDELIRLGAAKLLDDPRRAGTGTPPRTGPVVSPAGAAWTEFVPDASKGIPVQDTIAPARSA